MTFVQKQLFELQDSEYKDFQGKLLPTVDRGKIIGVRTPKLRKFAASLSKDKEESGKFLSELPHMYYDENNLHGFLIEKIKDYGECIEALESFFPYIDNWATCDSTNPKALKKDLGALSEKIREWLHSEHGFTVRFGMKTLMNYYLEGEFKKEYFLWVAEAERSFGEGICGENADLDSRDRENQVYYVKMMAAWYFATAFAKQYEITKDFFKEHKLSAWTHNKAIQKAVESLRITKEQKQELRKLKVNIF